MEKKPKKIGVYICHCGGNISDYVDVEKVRQSVEGEDIVFIAKTTMFACSDANQRDMVEDIKANNLDSVIVASCSPKLHQLTFRNVSIRADLNKYTIFLDEPAAGLNPKETIEVDHLVRKVADSGITVVLVEHDMKMVMNLSDRILVLDYGKKLAEGTGEEIRRNPDVIAAYLGAHA